MVVYYFPVDTSPVLSDSRRTTVSVSSCPYPWGRTPTPSSTNQYSDWSVDGFHKGTEVHRQVVLREVVCVRLEVYKKVRVENKGEGDVSRILDLFYISSLKFGNDGVQYG